MMDARGQPRRTPPATTGGAGFHFEDRVGAWFAAALLAGRQPLGPRFGTLARIRFQTERALDDIEVTSESDPERRWAASIKRFDMLSGASLREDFVSGAWQELTLDAFDADSDFVGFASGPVAPGNRRSVEKLIAAAGTDTPDGLAARINEAGLFNSTDREIWDSAKPAAGVVPPDKVDAAPARLLERLIALDLDFEAGNSARVAEALEWSRDALEPGQQATPEDLWQALCHRVAQVRPTGGSLDWNSLRRALPQFAFRLRPDAAPDWELLDRHTADSLASVRDELGGGLHLPRNEAWARLAELPPDSPLAFLTGPSGCGKTALAKRWVRAAGHRALWLTARHLEAGLAAFSSGLGLRLRVERALGLSEQPLRVVVDGLDRSLQGEEFPATAALARLAAQSDGNLQVLVTAQQLALEAVTLQLTERNAPVAVSPISIGNFDDRDVRLVMEERPRLGALAVEGELQSVLRRPKLLQVVLTALDHTAAEAIGPLNDEADVADLWWERLVPGADKQTARRELLLGLAARQADELVEATPAGELAALAVHADAADALRRDGILGEDTHRFAFEHDLFGDWSRFERLRAREDALPLIVEKSALPPWQRAIRLYALSVLQREGIDTWRRQHARLPTEGHLGADLYLDAPLFAPNADEFLAALWPTLADDNGRLLNRFLARFRHVATLPDPRGAQIFPDAPAIAASFAARWRIPIIAIWRPVLRLLSAHIEEVVDLATVQVAEVFDLWLRSTPRGFELRQAAAQNALALGRALTSDEFSNAYFDRGTGTRLWRAVLAAGGQDPEALADLCEALLATDNEAQQGENEGRVPMTQRRGRHWRRASELRKALLEPDVLIPLIETDPQRAQRVLVAGSITPPRPGHGWLFDLRDRLGITDEPHWLGPVPEHGPFRAFLQLAPNEALEAIIKLAEHATGHWREPAIGDGDADEGLSENEADEGFEIYRGGEWVRLVGDSDVMHWHRGNTFVPVVLASALMAAEAHLYRMLDEGKDVTEPIERILLSHSLALTGLLVSVACYKPELLAGPLRPLATSAGLLLADLHYKAEPHTDLLIPMWGEQVFADRMHEWHTMPHRERDLCWYVMSYVFNDGPLAEDVAVARIHWLETNRERWRHLAAQMDPANYELVDLGGGRQAWQYAIPAELRAEVESSNEEVAAASFWLAGPGRWRRLIDERVRPADEELDQLWNQWHAWLEKVEPEHDSPVGIRSRADVECGIAAFFVLCGYDWLFRHEDKLSWCREALLSPFADPPRRREFDTDRTPSAGSWDGFAADAIPTLWAQAPEDPELRAAAAALAVHSHYDTVGRLFDAVEKQSALKDDLLRLERLALQWARYAAWRSEKHRRKHFEDYPDFDGPRASDLPDVETPTRQAYEAFRSGELEPELPSFRAFLAETPDGMIGRRATRRPQLVQSINLEYFWAAFRHLLRMPDEPDQDERARRIRFASEFASSYAEGLAAGEGDDEVDGHPYDVERWLLEALGRLTVSVSLDSARAIWQPLVARGIAADDWLEIYLRAIWRATLAPEHLPPTAAPLLKDLLSFATSSHAWSSSRWRPCDCETSIAALDGYTAAAFRPEHADLIRALQPEWSAWVEPRANNYGYARSLAAFLKRPAAEPVLEAALGWLAHREREGGRVDHQLDEQLEELLLYLAASHEDLFRRQDETGAAARALLAALTARLRPVALELTSRFS
jgi:hypothetical protein